MPASASRGRCRTTGSLANERTTGKTFCPTGNNFMPTSSARTGREAGETERSVAPQSGAARGGAARPGLGRPGEPWRLQVESFSAPRKKRLWLRAAGPAARRIRLRPCVKSAGPAERGPCPAQERIPVPPRPCLGHRSSSDARPENGRMR